MYRYRKRVLGYKIMDEFLTVKDLVDMLKVSRFTISVWKKEKKEFPKPFNVGRKLLWKKSEIEAYMESTRKEKE
jgi:predicted DNA-binding transcriptional regulator AlpA